MKKINEIFSSEELSYLANKRPEIVPMDVPSKSSGIFDEPSLDQLIVQFLAKYEIFVEPRNVGSWNGWDTVSTVSSFLTPTDKLSSYDVAKTIFYANRSNQINSEAQEWNKWKRWVLDTKEQEFNLFKNQVFQSIIAQNRQNNEYLERQIQVAELHNRRAKLVLRGLDARIYIQKLKEKKEKQVLYISLGAILGLFLLLIFSASANANNLINSETENQITFRENLI